MTAQRDPIEFGTRIPDDIRERIRKLALEEPTLSPRAGVRFTDTDPPADGQTREVILSGEFSFLFERGRPAQPFP